jgi:hypothetical protein
MLFSLAPGPLSADTFLTAIDAVSKRHVAGRPTASRTASPARPRECGPRTVNQAPFRADCADVGGAFSQQCQS